MDQDKLVVLIHGFLRSRRSMKKLEEEFKKSGYHVLNVKYPLFRTSVNKITNIVKEQIMSFCVKRYQTVGGRPIKIQIVGHSLGGIVGYRLYTFMNDQPVHAHITPDHIFKLSDLLITVGAPRSGSVMARTLLNNPIGKFIFGDLVKELASQQYMERLYESDYDHTRVKYSVLAIIGSKKFSWTSPITWIGHIVFNLILKVDKNISHDGVVTEHECKSFLELYRTRERINCIKTVNECHTWIMNDPKVIKYCKIGVDRERSGLYLLMDKIEDCT